MMVGFKRNIRKRINTVYGKNFVKTLPAKPAKSIDLIRATAQALSLEPPILHRTTTYREVLSAVPGTPSALDGDSLCPPGHQNT
jgi:hypothetical protein